MSLTTGPCDSKGTGTGESGRIAMPLARQKEIRAAFMYLTVSSPRSPCGFLPTTWRECKTSINKT